MTLPSGKGDNGRSDGGGPRSYHRQLSLSTIAKAH
jgi:hypothetical protein